MNPRFSAGVQRSGHSTLTAARRTELTAAAVDLLQARREAFEVVGVDLQEDDVGFGETPAFAEARVLVADGVARDPGVDDLGVSQLHLELLRVALRVVDAVPEGVGTPTHSTRVRGAGNTSSAVRLSPCALVITRHGKGVVSPKM